MLRSPVPVAPPRMPRVAASAALLTLAFHPGPARAAEAPAYEHKETRALVELVQDAASVVSARGDASLPELRRSGSRWRRGETYVFVLDSSGNMLVHPDRSLEGRNALALEDVHGKLIIRGLIDAVTSSPKKTSGWYHYEWPVPGGLLPRWKSTYVQLVKTPSGQPRIVGAGLYNDRMERAFVVDLVHAAAAQIERDPRKAYALLRDPKGPFIAKDAYVFVVMPDGTDIVHPAFPNLEGKNLMEMKDTQGKALIRDMIDLAQKEGSGWVDYMWPKPGESVSTKKSTYVQTARVGESWVLVGSGVYLADAPRMPEDPNKLTAPQLVSLVGDAAKLLEERGEDAYPDLRRKGSRWYRDDTYFFVWDMDGNRLMHAADPSLEARSGRDVVDIHGRPYGEMFLRAAKTPLGEGWVHYMYPEPGNIFPTWKSVFVKRVVFPTGEQRLVGSGVYNMEMDPAFIVDVVQRASALVALLGRDAFPYLRDERGAFRFMDTYVFVDTPEGVELVNPAQPSLEGKDLRALRDVNGKLVAREYIDLALRRGAGWVDYVWYRPGENNVPVRKRSYVQQVRAGEETFIVGSGLYGEQRAAPGLRPPAPEVRSSGARL